MRLRREARHRNHRLIGQQMAGAEPERRKGERSISLDMHGKLVRPFRQDDDGNIKLATDEQMFEIFTTILDRFDLDIRIGAAETARISAST